MVDVNGIVCCGFTDAYSVLTLSKKGCLNDSKLYASALFSQQVSILENRVSSEYSCVSDSVFDSFSQKMQSCCGCCGVDSGNDTDKQPSQLVCPICFNVVGFTDDPQNDGIYADPDSEIIVVRDNGVFDPFFVLAGTGSVDYDIAGDFNYRSAVLINNPTSSYYGMIAVAVTDAGVPPFACKIEIWDCSQNPTPQLVIDFPFGNSGLNDAIYGQIAYDSLNDRVYVTTGLSRELFYLDLSTGTYTFVMSLGSWTPSGNVSGFGLSISPYTNKRYIAQTGPFVFPPDRGAIGVLLDDDMTIENILPFDSIYTTPNPTLDVEYAVTPGFVFDSQGFAYTVSAINANDYVPAFTQRDILKLDPITNEIVGILNYDPSLVWLPVSGNSANQSTMQYYDGTGLIQGEKILVTYRNIGPPAAPLPTGNTFPSFPGTATRLVAFDTQAPYAATVILEIPDSLYSASILRFFYSYQFNKIFGMCQPNNLYAFTISGNNVYSETFPYTGGFIYQAFDLPESSRCAFISAEPNPTENLYVIEPQLFCPEGRIYVLNEGTYEFNGSEWTPMIESQSFTQSGDQWNVTAQFNDSVFSAKLQYTYDLTNYFDLEDVTGDLYNDPTEWANGLVFVVDSDENIWFRIVISTGDECLVYGEIYPEPPPLVDFVGDPLSIYRYNDVSFTDLSVGVPTSWNWTFEQGTPSTSSVENPVTSYNSVGVFDVTLSATNTNGTNSLTKTNYITVIDGLLLNYVQGSQVGYSLRKIDITYTGPCIRVRRDSDNVEQDISFVNGELDLASLSAFCGTDNGFVVYWYDQSGNGNDLFNLTFAEQPQIYSIGLPILENGKPCMVFDGSNDTMNMLTAVTTTAMSVSIVASQTLNTGIRPLVGTSLANQITPSSSFGMGVAASSQFDLFNPSASTSQGLYIYHRNGLANPNSLKSAFRNGTQLTIGTSLITNQVGTYTAVAGAPGANRFGGKVQELIIWDSYKASKNSVIQDNVNEYYNIY